MVVKRHGPSPETTPLFFRDFRVAAVVAAIAMVILMLIRTAINDSNELNGPFNSLPAWPFYTRLGIPLLALGFAITYSICAAIVRHVLSRGRNRKTEKSKTGLMWMCQRTGTSVRCLGWF